MVFPAVTDDGFGVTAEVVTRELTVNDDVPELAACMLSPE